MSRRWRGSPDQRGSGTVLVIGVLAVLLMVGSAAAVVAGYAVAAHGGRAAADLAALSGAQAAQSGDDPCAAARQIADRNHADLADCAMTGEAGDFVVAVTVEVKVRVRVPGLPTRLTQRAWAGVLPPE